MSFTKINTQFIDLNLISGSSETMRLALNGGYYNLVLANDGDWAGQQRLVYEPMDDNEVNYDSSKSYITNEIDKNDLGSIIDKTHSRVNWAVDYTSEYFTEEALAHHIDALTEAGLSVTTNTGVPPIKEGMFMPTYSIPVRFRGNKDLLETDSEWQAYWVGGTHGAKTYPGIYNTQVYQDYRFTYTAPYSQKTIKLIQTEDIDETVSVKYQYNIHSSLYENYASATSELLIPNAYFIYTFSDSDPETTTFESDFSEYPTGVESYVWDFVTLERNVVPEYLLDSVYVDDPTLSAYDPTKEGSFIPWDEMLEPEQIEQRSVNLMNYLTSSLLVHRLSSSTEQQILTNMQHVFFDAHSIETFYPKIPGGTSIGGLLSQINRFPYYVSIEMPLTDAAHDNYNGALSGVPLDTVFDDPLTVEVEGTTHPDAVGSFGQAMISNHFDKRFLKIIKESFVEIRPEVPVVSHNYVMNQQYKSGSASGVDSEIETNAIVTLRSCEYSDLLVYAYNDYESEDNNFHIMGDKTYINERLKDPYGVYRYDNTTSTTNVLAHYSNFATGYFYRQVIESGAHAETVTNSTREAPPIGRVYSQAGEDKYHETIAYRIEKISGTPSGDSLTRSTLQNFYYINSQALQDSGLRLDDTQVKYGQDYTYVIYAYVMVYGYKYALNNLSVARHIGFVEDLDKYCLEFRDPYTGDTKEQLFQAAYSDELHTTNEFSTNSQITSDNPYLADLNLELEPSMKIMEIPVYAKTVRVQDNPATDLDVYPFQVMDDSQQIGFFINYETQLGGAFPACITDTDIEQKISYLSSNDLFDWEPLVDGRTPARPLPPISKVRYFEIYRSTNRPEKFSDFDGKLYKTLDLKIENSKEAYSSKYFYDKINTNTRYYYLFRAVTEQGTIGHIPEIYEAQLIDDGGYKYAIFNTFFESDLEKDALVKPSKGFKKLLQLEPNLSQVAMIDTDVDYTQEAGSQIENLQIGNAEDLIWGKTFKLRLSSKKTGKKIDLNITYNLRSE